MKRAVLIIGALCSIAVLFGWKAQDAWFAPPPSIGAAGAPATGLPGSDEPASEPAPPQEIAAAVTAVAARPLFRPDRLPFRDGTAGAGPDVSAELSRLTLIGVLTFGRELKGVVIAKDGPAPGRWELKAGDSLLGFKVREVRTDGMTLTANGRKFQLPLYAGPPTAEGGSLRTEVFRNAPSKGGAYRPAPTMHIPPKPPLPAGAAGQGRVPARIQPIDKREDQGENK